MTPTYADSLAYVLNIFSIPSWLPPEVGMIVLPMLGVLLLLIRCDHQEKRKGEPPRSDSRYW